MDFIVRKNETQNTNRIYFTKETENAIIQYNKSQDPEERTKIYHDKIHYPFFKLTQNLIHTFKFYYTEVENLEDLQHEVITFLLEKIHLFNPDNGAKAYSYFGTIAKNYLILSNQKNYKNKVNNTSLEELDNYSNQDFTDPSFIVTSKKENELKNLIFDEDLNINLNGGGVEVKETYKLSIFLDKYVEYCSNNLYKIFSKEEDTKIADAILEIFRKRENIDVFNKKALYIYIREIINVKTPKITKVANNLYKIFQDKYLFYLENDYFPK